MVPIKKIICFFSVFFTLTIFSQSITNVFPLKDVKEGTIAKGYTVLKGTIISEFEAEVLGVQRIGSSDTPYIICKIKGKPFDECGVVAAMSGSPLYIEDKFLGAVAIGWFFSKEPLFAATPAEKMVELYQKRFSGSVPSTPQKTVTFFDFLNNLGNINSDMNKLLAPFEEKNITISKGEKHSFAADATIEPGGMIGVELISGDISLTAYGTISSVKENRFIAFGHPFLGVGEVDFPVVKAKVSTIMPSMAFSFKLSSSQEEIGRMVLDTPYGVLCEKGIKANTIPVTIYYENSSSEKFIKTANIVRHKDLAKMLFFLAVSQLCDELESNKKSYHIILNSANFLFDDGKSLTIKKQIFGGEDPLLSLSSFLAEIFSLLYSNPFKKPEIKGVELNIISKNGKSDGNLIQISSLSNEIERGNKINIEAIFQKIEEKPLKIHFEIPSTELPDGKVKIVAGDSISIFKRYLKASNTIPTSFDEIISSLNKLNEGGKIYIALFSESESLLIGNKRIYDIPMTLKNSLSFQVANSNQKSTEKICLEPFPVYDSGFFSSELEITTVIKERENQ